MPRLARSFVADFCYHVISRGNDRRTVFHDRADYLTFLALIDQAKARTPVRLLGYCLMPNHFHLVLWPREANDISRWMQWLLTTHVRRHHLRHGGSGHLWQGAFKAFPIQDDRHLLTVMRYVEGNPSRCALVERARDWPWSSLGLRERDAGRRLDAGPLPLPADWPDIVDTVIADDLLTSLRRSVNRGAPFGTGNWVGEAAKRLGLESTVRSRGRRRVPAAATPV